MADKKKSFLDKSVDFIFSDSPVKWLILIFILGFILRFFVASNLTLVADEGVHGTHAIGILDLKPLSTMTQCPIWFYLTDLSYNIFGINLLGARFIAVLFGALSIVLVFMITSLFANRKTALIAAFLLAVSSYHISWLAIYMDESMMFFILLATYLFMKEFKEKGTISVASSIFLGIAILIKIIAAVFSLVFILFILVILYKNYKSKNPLFRRNLKRAVIFVIILALASLPIIAYNYFLYKSKGIVDLPFAQYFNINREFYEGPGLAHGQGFTFSKIFEGLYVVFILYFFKSDPLILILAFLGLPLWYFLYKKNKFSISFLSVLFIFPILFIMISILLQTHYTSFSPFLAMFAALSLSWISEKLDKYLDKKKVLAIICLILLVFSVYSLWTAISSKSAYDQMRRFAESSITDNDLVVVDARIYNGFTTWMFNDKHYVNSATFPAFVEQTRNITSKSSSVHVFFVECVPDDCGWGTMTEDFIKNMDDLYATFKNLSKKKAEFAGGGIINGIKMGEVVGEPHLIVYESNLNLHPGIVNAVDQTHEFFFYPVRRNLNPKQAFDYYEVNGFFDSCINFIAYLVLYSLIFLAILSPLIVVYFLLKYHS